MQIIGGTLKDLLAPLRELQIPYEISRPLIPVLMTEVLVGPGQATPSRGSFCR